MGFLDSIRAAVTLRPPAGGVVPFESPWASPNHLDHFDRPQVSNTTLTRTAAMKVPAVARARQLIVTNGPRCPLRLAGNAAGPANPAWLDRTDGPVAPYHRMLWTFDDLFFHGWSLWAVTRDAAGHVLAADRVPFADWTIDPTSNAILWHGHRVNAADVVLIPGISEGVLAYGVDGIGHAADLADAIRRSGRTPALNTIIKQVSGEPLPPDKRREIVTDFVNARRQADHGVSFAGANVDVVETGRSDPALLVDGRNAAAIDVARLTGIPAALLDADAGAAMTYQNTSARMAELVDFGLAPYMAAIAGRLSLDDVLPAGQTVEFDTTALTGVAGGVTPPDDNARPQSVTPLEIARPA